MPQKIPAIGEDVSHLFSGGGVPAIGEDVSHLFADSGGHNPFDPNSKPPSAEDFAPPQRDVSVGNMLWNAAKSIPAGIVDTAKLLYTDQRPEDAGLGPMQALAPLIRAAGTAARAEGGKTVEAAKQGRVSEAIGHAAATALPLVGPAAAQAGEDIGSGDTARIERGGGNAIGLVGSMLAPSAVAKVAPRVAPALATVGEQLAAKGRAVATAAGPAAMEIAKTLPLELAGHYLGGPLGSGVVARVLLKNVLDTAKGAKGAVVNAGGRLVSAASKASPEADIAKALEELKAPSLPDSVELPPPAELPPGYTPRTSAPEPVAPVNAGGRLVAPGAAPTTEQALADAVAQARVPEPPALVTTPPEPTLPPGYTPRSTVPKPKAVKAELPKPVQDAIAAGEKKRAYFLKPADQVAAEAAAPPPATSGPRAYFLKSADQIAQEAAAKGAPKITPSGTITQADLPAAWRSHTGQDIFPITGEEGKAVASALMDELKTRGMSPGEAMALVSKNKTIPVQLRAQLLRAINKAGAVK